mgnify:FL=1
MTTSGPPQGPHQSHADNRLSVGWRLAVDFGTTNTAAAVEHDGQVYPLRLSADSHLMRSAVLMVDGEIRTGTAATRGAAVHPAGFEPTPKRRLGEEHIALDGSLVEPVTLVAAVLRKVYEHALADADQIPPHQVVLTHPQAWHAHRIGLLRTAAEQAGIPPDRLHLVSEPVATAWFYTAGDPPPPGAYLAVLDLGGGTSDAALLRYTVEAGHGHYEVIDSDGIDPLGGHDFDARLESWVLDQARHDRRQDLLDALADPTQPRARLTLRDDVRAAKESLSENQSETIGVTAAGQQWVGTITREEYEQLIGADIDRAVGLVRNVLAGLPPDTDIHRLYLTGGSSLTPLLNQRLQDLLPGRTGTRGDRKQVTALGALHIPAVSAPPPPERQGNTPVDRQPGTFGDPAQPDPAPSERNLSKVFAVTGGVVAAAAAMAFVFIALRPDPPPDDDDGPGTGGETSTASEETTRPPEETTTVPEETTTPDVVIASAADMERLVVDHQLALASSCADTDLDKLGQRAGEVIYFSCSEPLTDGAALLDLMSYPSVSGTQAAFDSWASFWEVSGYIPVRTEWQWGDGAALMLQNPDAGWSVFTWSDESTMTLSVFSSTVLSADDLRVHWTSIPDYYP